MGFLRIHCDYCGGTWDVYGGKDWKNANNRVCPHCHEKIDGQDWNNQILPAFGAMMDANRELIKTHTGYHTPLFTVDYIEDYYFPDANRATETAMFNLENRIEELHDTVDLLDEKINIIATSVIAMKVKNEMSDDL